MARIQEELYKKYLYDPENHDGMITHLEPDILECEVKCALESITINKASGGDGIPGCLALGKWSHHRDYLGHEDLVCTVLLCILATSS